MGAVDPPGQKRNTAKADAAWTKGQPRAGFKSCGTLGLVAAAEARGLVPR